jgi:hypothetical protein
MKKPNFTDKQRYPQGYVRSEATDISKTWAAARRKLEEGKRPPEGNVRTLARIAGART